MILSVCMIVRDGEPHLARALASARDVADELVVVDTGSVDGSVDIARRFGAQVRFFEWVDDFSAARNASLAPAAGDWILQLDADHELVVAPGFDLRAFLRAAPAAGYVIRETVERAGVASYLDRLLLFRRFPALRYRGVVHEHPGEAVAAYGRERGIEPPVRPLPEVRVLHHGYETEADEKLARNRRLLERAVASSPADLHARYKLVATLRAQGEREAYAEALAASVPFVRAAVEVGAVDLPVIGLIGRLAVDRPDEAADALVEAAGEAIGWGDVRLAVPAARRRLADGRAEAAAALLERCFDAGLAVATATSPGALKAEAAALLLRAYLAAKAPARVLHLLRVLPEAAPRLGLDLQAALERLREEDPAAFEAVAALVGRARG